MDVLFQSASTLLAAKPGVASAETTPVTTPAEAGDRSLLARWFRTLRDRVRLSDRHHLNSQNVRVESSTASDWWIHVHPKGLKQHERCGFFGHHACMSSPEDDEGLFNELREALLVMTMLARVDYGAWYEQMNVTSGLRLTKAQRADRVECKFAFTLEGSVTRETNGWRDKVDILWGNNNENFSEEFVSSLLALHAMARKKNVAWGDVIKPLPVRFEFAEAAASPEAQGSALDHVTDAVVHARQFGFEKRHGIREVLPSFLLQTVELYLWRHDVHPVVFNALERLVDTKVPIDFLALPGRYNRDSIDQEVLQQAWRSLAHKLLGCGSATPDVQIDRLEISSASISPDLLASWLPMLQTATNLRSLSIQGQEAPLLSTSVFWRHLANGIFSQQAKNSIESLELAGLGDISADAVAEFERIISPSRAEDHGPDQPSLRTLVLRLAPGPQPTPGLDGSLDVGPKQWIPRILQLAGRSIIALAIDRADVDDLMLDQCLRACPNLESLRINGAMLQSLDALVEAYDRPPSSKLASLELRLAVLPIDAFESFLSTVADENSAIHSTLSRLRVGEGWSSAFRKSTTTALEDVVVSNKTLATLQVYRPAGPFSSIPVADWDCLKTHDGSFLAEVDTPLELQSRLAFLGSLRRLSGNNAIPAVAEDPLRNIIAFAAKARRRSVLVLPDVSDVQY